MYNLLPNLESIKEISNELLFESDTTQKSFEIIEKFNSNIYKYLQFFEYYGLANNTICNFIEKKITIQPDDWIRINELFIPEDLYSGDDKNNLWFDNTIRFISSFKNMNEPLLFCINSSGSKVDILLSSGDKNNSRLKNSLEEFFPGIDYNYTRFSPVATVKKYICGIPSIEIENNLNLPFDNFIKSLYGQRFSYFIKIQSVEDDAINQIINKLSNFLDYFNTINNLSITINTTTGQGEQIGINLEKESCGRLINYLKEDIDRCNSGLRQGLWLSKSYICSDNLADLEKTASLLHGVYGGDKSFPMRMRTSDKESLTLIKSKEVATFFSFPTNEFPGILLKKLFNFSSNSKTKKNIGKSIHLGTIFYNMQETKNNYNIELKSLTKHMFISGITGSGKTNTIKHILEELLKKKIPFLLIEPVKTEYKDLTSKYKNIINYIEIGNDNFKINPFEPADKAFNLISHIDYLKAVFNSSFIMYPPMPYILETVIYLCYEEYSYKFDKYDKHDKYPTINDLINLIKQFVSKSTFDERLKGDITASLLIRFKNLLRGFKGNILNTAKANPNFNELFTKPTILNLNRITDDEQKALIMSLILVYLYEYRNVKGSSDNLIHVTLIEEAHRLLAKTLTADGNPDFNNPKSKAVEFFCNMISEIRSYGEGFIIAEQIPSKIVPDVIKNSSTKIIHKLVANDDKTVIANSMNFREGQEQFFTILEAEKGQAVIFSDNTVNPIIVKIPEFKI
jgi:DNA helicase HerA-like ATPase